MRATTSTIKRKQILDAALDIFSSKGFHNATIAEVASRAHVGKGTVYLYFSGKEALLVSIFDELADQIVEIFDEIAREEADLQLVVRRVFSREAKQGRSSGQIMQILAQQPFLSTLSLQRNKRLLIERVVDGISERICAAIGANALRDCDPVLAACFFLSLPGALTLYAAACPGSGLPGSLPGVAQSLAEMMWLGLRKETK